ncbi:MAG TPA: hypothetical protein VG675_23260 [Bryobacteraceae bacterium]|nr:hypothetical protein [Bryobacteraceae bacterium]
MSISVAFILFLAATVIAVFAFLSIVVWVTAPARERQARDRLALLKAIAESPSAQASQVLDLIRKEDAARAERREREDRRGWIVGGLITMAVGIGSGLMASVAGNHDSVRLALAAALIPFLIGCVLLGVGLSPRRRAVQPHDGTQR